jgi:hypothetical protein
MVTRLIFGAIALGAVVVVAASLPDIARYLKLRDM